MSVERPELLTERVVERAQAYADQQTGTFGANAFDDRARESCTVLEAAAKLARAGKRAEQLVPNAFLYSTCHSFAS